MASNTGSNAASNPATSLSAITLMTPISRRKSNSSSNAAASAAAPCGLCAASRKTVGAGADRQLDIEAVRAGAEEGLDRRECERRVGRLMGAMER